MNALQNKRCLVTGANSGIGKVTAMALLEEGAHLLMLCRNPLKAGRAKQEMLMKYPEAEIDLFYVDFSSQKQIREVAQEIRERYKQIDILVNNAGFIAGNRRQESEDGLEMSFAVNHIGYFLLTAELMPLLKAAPKARIINVASEAHRFAGIDFDNLQLTKGYGSIRAYGLSKLCNILFTRELAERLKGSNITANAVHPGGVRTNFAQDAGNLMTVVFKMASPFLLTPEQGAETSIYLATDAKVEGKTGLYFSRKKPVRPSAAASSAENAQKLWQISAEICGISPAFV